MKQYALFFLISCVVLNVGHINAYNNDWVTSIKSGWNNWSGKHFAMGALRIYHYVASSRSHKNTIKSLWQLGNYKKRTAALCSMVPSPFISYVRIGSLQRLSPINVSHTPFFV